MTDEQNIIQVKIERRSYRPFEAKKPRLRNVCPKCKSLNVKKRRVCNMCKWEGTTVIKVDY